MTVLLCQYFLFCYTEWVWEYEARYQVGWLHIGIMTLNVIFNFAFMTVISAYNVKLKCKRRKAKKIAEQAAKERSEKALAKAA